MDLFCNSIGIWAPAICVNACCCPSTHQPFSSKCPKHKIGRFTILDTAARSLMRTVFPVMSRNRISISCTDSTGISLPWASCNFPMALWTLWPFPKRLTGKIEASAPESSKMVWSFSESLHELPTVLKISLQENASSLTSPMKKWATWRFPWKLAGLESRISKTKSSCTSTSSLTSVISQILETRIWVVWEEDCCWAPGCCETLELMLTDDVGDPWAVETWVESVEMFLTWGCQQSRAICPARPQLKHCRTSPLPFPFDRSPALPLDPFESLPCDFPFESFPFCFPCDCPLANPLSLDFPFPLLPSPFCWTRSISIGTGPSVLTPPSEPSTICSDQRVVEASYIKIISRTLEYVVLSVTWSCNHAFNWPVTLLIGQRVICAHWKRVICAHCKRVIRAQRNRVIRAQRAVIRAHWCWEPAISGLVGVGWGGWGGGGGGGGVGWGGMITFMFLCTHRHSNLIIFLAVEKRQAQLFHDQLPVGWGELIRFMFLCLHTHSNLIIFLAVEHLHALLFHDQLPLGGVGVGGWGGWGGVGWDDNVHVPMHTQAQQPHHLSSRRAETGTALSWSVTGGVGWVNKVHVPMPAHAQQPHHLSCCRAPTRTALSWSVTLGGGGGGGGWGGWGGVGW